MLSAVILNSYSTTVVQTIKNICDRKKFLIKFTPGTPPKKHPLQIFFNILTRCAEELHFIIAFCSTPIFAEHHSRSASKAKYERAIDNSVKCCSPHEKIQLMFDLVTKTFFNDNIKQSTVFYYMKPF